MGWRISSKCPGAHGAIQLPEPGPGGWRNTCGTSRAGPAPQQSKKGARSHEVVCVCCSRKLWALVSSFSHVGRLPGQLWLSLPPPPPRHFCSALCPTWPVSDCSLASPSPTPKAPSRQGQPQPRTTKAVWPAQNSGPEAMWQMGPAGRAWGRGFEGAPSPWGLYLSAAEHWHLGSYQLLPHVTEAPVRSREQEAQGPTS